VNLWLKRIIVNNIIICSMPPLLKFLKENLKSVFWATGCGFVMSYFIWRGCCSSIFQLFWIGCFTALMWVALWLGNAYVSCVLDYYFPWEKQTVTRLIAGLIGMVVLYLRCCLRFNISFWNCIWILPRVKG
jgi:hypothetical protein